MVGYTCINVQFKEQTHKTGQTTLVKSTMYILKVSGENVSKCVHIWHMKRMYILGTVYL